MNNTVKKPLTDRQCKLAKYEGKSYRLYDIGRLFLYIQKTKKTFYLKYRFNNKENTFKIGNYPEVSLLDARRRRDEIKSNIDNGIDPSLQRKIEKASLNIDNSFESVFNDWFPQKRKRFRSEKHAHDVYSSVQRFVLPTLGRIPVDKITTPMVKNVIDNIGTISDETRSKVKGRVSEVF